LSEARLAAGLSVDDVIFRTRIPRGVILALEAGDFTFFSSPTYAKSFLSQYSGFLGVEATLWLDALQPAYFIADETMSPYVSSTEAFEVVAPRNSWRSGNLGSTFAWFALTAGLMFAAVKSFDYFETRHGAKEEVSAGMEKEATPAPATEGKSGKDAEDSSGLSDKAPSMVPHPPDSATASQSGDEAAASAESSEKNPLTRPPRALIVHEPSMGR
jgi:cytoskeletal protein RodZ